MSQKNNNQGFTLVEVLIAVAILAVTLTAMANLVIVTMRANQSNMNTLQGYYLAEQGLEAMRNMRDSNWLQNYGWNLGDDLWGDDFDCSIGNDSEDLYFIVDEDTAVTIGDLSFERGADGVLESVMSFGSVADNSPWDLNLISESAITLGSKLYLIEEAEGYVRFAHDSSGEETIFSRYIKVSYDDCESGIAQVSSIVFWNERGTDREVVLTTYLTDWQS